MLPTSHLYVNSVAHAKEGICVKQKTLFVGISFRFHDYRKEQYKIGTDEGE
jgi:hypothetical protein